MPSVELSRFLHLRADGLSTENAAFESGIGLKEAELWEQAIASGEVELPRARARARAREEQPKTEGNVANGNVAADELRLLIERVERLEEERKGLAEDISDVFKEAKSRGFDKAAMKRCIKLRRMEHHQLREAEAILHVYMNALGLELEPSVALGIAA